jgi:N-acetylglucosaminyldiphosphoundecaprenol N-acetyl-beta-D-mannosaminyltransferase
MMNVMGYEISSFQELKVRILKDEKTIINTLNPHSFCLALYDDLFRHALSESDILIPDGIGIVIAARVINHRTIKKIAGYDMHDFLLMHLNETQGSCFYLGSNAHNLQGIYNRLQVDYPSIKVGFFSPPFCDEFNPEENLQMVNVVNAFHPDVLFVGLTAPKQEKWVYLNQAQLTTPIVCCIGAVFDFYARTIPRPGPFWSKFGLEWFVRFIREPNRMFKRVFYSTPIFCYHILKELVKVN